MCSKRRHSRTGNLRGRTAPGDAVDPHGVSHRRDRGRSDRKAQQLCRQVSHTLNYVLSGECHDDVLRSLYVENVVPAPDSSRLLVTLSVLDKDDATPLAVILTKLAAVHGKLRSEVAASISRRKTPELLFNVVRPEDIPLPPPELPQPDSGGDDV